jgi:hypothetical protein
MNQLAAHTDPTTPPLAPEHAPVMMHSVCPLPCWWMWLMASAMSGTTSRVTSMLLYSWRALGAGARPRPSSMPARASPACTCSSAGGVWAAAGSDGPSLVGSGSPLPASGADSRHQQWRLGLHRRQHVVE